MEVTPTADWFFFFAMLLFPGLVSMRVYRLLMPSKDIDWKDGMFEALFYGTINIVLCFPLITKIHGKEYFVHHPVRYWMSLVFIILVVPILLPPIWVKILKLRIVGKYLQLPFPTAWDYFFDKRKPVFILIHMRSGGKIGGYFVSESYATSFPKDGDIYLEKVIKVDADGKFIKEIPESCGLLIRRDEYSLLEFHNEPH